MKRLLLAILAFHMTAWSAEPDPFERRLIGQFVKIAPEIGFQLRVYENLEIETEIGRGDIKRITGRRYEININGPHLQSCEILISTPEEARELGIVGVRGSGACQQVLSGGWKRYLTEEQPDAETQPNRLQSFVNRMIKAAQPQGANTEAGGMR